MLFVSVTVGVDDGVVDGEVLVDLVGVGVEIIAGFVGAGGDIDPVPEIANAPEYT